MEEKKRQFVTWTQEEDDILREKYQLHGERWSTIASYLKNKTSRQCKRRLSGYLSSDSKKGSWSTEEDRLLLEAHRKYGNRWTEIAKVVSGRTDNAVKNRFHALLNKQAKRKENSQPVSFLDDRVSHTSSESSQSCKIMRVSTSEPATGHSIEVQSVLHSRKVLGSLPHENLSNMGFMNAHGHFNLLRPFVTAAQPNSQVSSVSHPFVKSEDPKFSALVQQAELLKTLAEKRIAKLSNAEHKDATMDYSERQDGEEISKESVHRDSIPLLDQPITSSPSLANDNNLDQERFLSLERLRRPSMPKLCEPCEVTSQRTSQFSVKSDLSTNLSRFVNDDIIQIQTPVFMDQSFQTSSSTSDENQLASAMSEDGSCCSASVQHVSLNQTEGDESAFSLSVCEEYSSPVHVNPVFRSTGDGIFSPQFSESEKQFLLNLIPPASGTSERYSLPLKRGSPACRKSLSNRL